MGFETASGFLDAVDGRIDRAQMLIFHFNHFAPRQNSGKCIFACGISLNQVESTYKSRQSFPTKSLLLHPRRSLLTKTTGPCKVATSRRS
jgi:hypothetical protein